jgi:hypothetical protein
MTLLTFLHNLTPGVRDFPVPPALAQQGVVRVAGDGTQYNAAGWIIGPPHILELEAQRYGRGLDRYLEDAAAAVAQVTA